MPRRELSRPQQIIDWLVEWGAALAEPATMTLIGSAALLWHSADRGLDEPLPENSMDVDPITDSDALAWMCYDALIGSEFERRHGWHVNLLPTGLMPTGRKASASRDTSLHACTGHMKMTFRYHPLRAPCVTHETTSLSGRVAP